MNLCPISLSAGRSVGLVDFGWDLLDEDEVCAFVVEEAAWLMECERASIMLVDPQTGELRIRAAVGLPEAISDGVAVRPGQGISGKVFESGHGIVHNEGDPMPADSLTLTELRDSNCFLSGPLKGSSQAAQRRGPNRMSALSASMSACSGERPKT